MNLERVSKIIVMTMWWKNLILDPAAVGEGKFLFEKKGEAGPEWMELPNGTHDCT